MQLRQDAPLDSDADVDRDGAQEAALRRNGTRPGRGGLREKFAEQPLLNSVLVALCIAAIVLAITAIGPASSSTGQSTRTTTVKRGVVQSTVSGSGNVQSADQLNLGFKTSGTVTQIDVKEGQHVVKGQLLATLDPKSAEVTLEQAKATLQSAEAGLAKEEETGGETASGQSAGASAASTSGVAYTAATTTTESPAPAPTTTTAPATTTPATTTPGAATRTSKPKSERSTTTPQSNSEQGSETSTGKGTAATSEQSEATREANLASAGAAVKSDKLTVENAEQAVENTKLYAPQDGTIVTLSGEVGETVSGTGTTKSSSSVSATGSSSTGGSATTGGSAGGSSTTGASSSSAQGSSGSSSSFAALSDLESLQLIVALSESEIGSVHTGQIATVTIEALNGRKVGAHVVSVSQVPTSSSGAVSYDVTFQLDQEAAGLKVGMSATAEVVVKQAEGLNVATSAIKGGSVTVLRDGKREARSITTGLAGDNTTIVLSGLKAGEEVVLASATSSGSSLSSRLGSRSGRVGSSGLGGALSGGGAFPAGGPPGG